ncbi:branched-chain amino acid ABC transporter permease [Falsochrobactrum shanghaiense]|uniref:Branched-chain amino acid ABC transporter permease n=1 Tax=Falsochrobactrum shanghaiense TaxID=2201899 RepID=A0A316JCU9_9HYPH|nr:AzlC family ABC transporter permease [Falsochrobactrum shanghaiense]PWL19118.1 branched-chain amino acid ABC transporter permease [Falsochrobactrum shanghaiense]
MKKEFLSGMRVMFPLIAAVIPIGAIYGAVAAGKGLSTLEVVLMSALVFAGGSQFVAMDIWTHPASWTAVGFAALLVNLRLVLMSASIGPHVGQFTGWRKYAAILFLTDEIWAIAELKAREGRLTPIWYAGIALPFYAAWVLSSLFGALAGNTMGDPALIGLDFAFPAVFIVLMMSFWKGRRTGAVLLASAIAAITAHQLLGGVWYIAAGALAGLAVAMAHGPAAEEKSA